MIPQEYMLDRIGEAENLGDLYRIANELVKEYPDTRSYAMIAVAVDLQRWRLENPGVPASQYREENLLAGAFAPVVVPLLPRWATGGLGLGLGVKVGSPLDSLIVGYGESVSGQLGASIAHKLGLVTDGQYEIYKETIPPGKELKWWAVVLMLVGGVVFLLFANALIKKVLGG